MKKLLNICIQIEDTAGKIYRNMAESPHLNSPVRQALTELASDEDQHAAQLRFALRFPEDSIVSSQPEMLNKAQALLVHAEHALQQTDKTAVTDQQAIEIGIKLEKNFCQAHIGNSFDFKDTKHQAMFAAMAKADEEHCQRLIDLQATFSHP